MLNLSIILIVVGVFLVPAYALSMLVRRWCRLHLPHRRVILLAGTDFGFTASDGSLVAPSRATPAEQYATPSNTGDGRTLGGYRVGGTSRTREFLPREFDARSPDRRDLGGIAGKPAKKPAEWQVPWH